MDVSENEIGLREARAQLGDLVNRAEYSGEITYITRHGRRAAAIVPITLIPQEPAMTVTLYETNSDILVIARGQDAWTLQVAGSHMVGQFVADAEAWINGDWEPNEGDGQNPTHLDDLTKVATWDADNGLTLLVRPDSLGGAAREYLPAAATTETAQIAQHQQGHRAAAIVQEQSMNVRDLTAAVKTTLGDHVDHHDVEGIVEEIGNRYGYDIDNIDDVPASEYWAIVEQHATD